MYQIQLFVYLTAAFLIALSVHEAAHAWAANELGDPTARYMGRLTLNPMAHLDPVGTLLILMIIFSSAFGAFGGLPIIGWGKPVPVNPAYLRKGPFTGRGIVSLAGPASNFLVAIIAAVPFRLGLPLPETFQLLFLIVVLVNIGLGVFNLLPVPPLDGYSVLMGLLSVIRAPWAYEWLSTLARFEAQLPMLLFIIILLDWVLPFSLLGAILGPPNELLQWLILGR